MDIHTPPTPADLPDNTRTIIQELRPKTPPPTTRTTTSSAHRTLSSSYPEMPVQSTHPPLIEVGSPHGTILDYLQVSDKELESERDSFRTNPIAGPSTPPGNTSSSTPSSPKAYKTADFHEVPEPPQLDYK